MFTVNYIKCINYFYWFLLSEYMTLCKCLWAAWLFSGWCQAAAVFQTWNFFTHQKRRERETRRLVRATPDATTPLWFFPCRLELSPGLVEAVTSLPSMWTTRTSAISTPSGKLGATSTAPTHTVNTRTAVIGECRALHHSFSGTCKNWLWLFSDSKHKSPQALCWMNKPYFLHEVYGSGIFEPQPNKQRLGNHASRYASLVVFVWCCVEGIHSFGLKPRVFQPFYM